MPPQVSVSAPGKVILSGEHAVVYGYPALVASTDFRAKVRIEKINKGLEIIPSEANEIIKKGIENANLFLGKEIDGLKILLNSQIPIGSGMGSSAAVAVALAFALIKIIINKTTLEQVNKLAYLTEKFYHGNPSGVDVAISTYGGYLWYRKETEDFKVFSKVTPNRKLTDFVLVDSGKPLESTKEMVSFYVSGYYKRHPQRVEGIFRNIEKVTKGFLRYILNEENISIIDLIRENERNLESLGVVSEFTKELIRKVEKLGGAAKISGAGGRKGNSGIVLVYHKDEDKLKNILNKWKLIFMDVKFGSRGVTYEKNS